MNINNLALSRAHKRITFKVKAWFYGLRFSRINGNMVALESAKNHLVIVKSEVHKWNEQRVENEIRVNTQKVSNPVLFKLLEAKSLDEIIDRNLFSFKEVVGILNKY